MFDTMHIYPEIERQTFYTTKGNVVSLYPWQLLITPPKFIYHLDSFFYAFLVSVKFFGSSVLGKINSVDNWTRKRSPIITEV